MQKNLVKPAMETHFSIKWHLEVIQGQAFLRATAVLPGTAEARISYGNYVCLSVRLSVRHDPVRIQCQVK